MSTASRTTIKPSPNGPYIVKNLKHCRDQNGPIETEATMALCRCGRSSRKPFCDGSHAKVGFSSDKSAARTPDKRESYIGKQVTIHDNRGLCAHAGVCTDNLASVFRMGEEPWIDPDAATVDEIVAIVEKCPSGALGYTIGDSERTAPAGAASIRIVPQGPYAVSGEVVLEADWGEGASSSRFTLCRCGASKNKPFCDGSHWDVDFDDTRD